MRIINGVEFTPDIFKNPYGQHPSGPNNFDAFVDALLGARKESGETVPTKGVREVDVSLQLTKRLVGVEATTQASEDGKSKEIRCSWTFDTPSGAKTFVTSMPYTGAETIAAAFDAGQPAAQAALAEAWGAGT